jgi:hypothetical protein
LSGTANMAAGGPGTPAVAALAITWVLVVCVRPAVCGFPECYMDLPQSWLPGACEDAHTALSSRLVVVLCIGACTCRHP